MSGIVYVNQKVTSLIRHKFQEMLTHLKHEKSKLQYNIILSQVGKFFILL